MDTVQIVQAIVLAGVCAVACALSWHALRNWRGDRYLCSDCRFNDETLCLKADRGHALTCTAYESVNPRGSLNLIDKPKL